MTPWKSIKAYLRRRIKKDFPATLTLRRIYILPTTYGLMYMVIVFAMFIGSINYNNNLGFLLTFLLSSIGFVGILRTYRMLHCLEVVFARAKPVFAGQSAIVRVRVRSGKTDRKCLDFKFSNGKSSTTDLGKDAESIVKVNIPTSKRGLFKTGRLVVESTYPFGLFRAWSTIENSVEYLVFPKPFPNAISFDAIAAGEDNRVTTPKQGTEDFNGLFAYQDGDPPHRIFWKAYSKGRGLFIKSFSGGSGSAIVLDMEKLKDADLETRLSKLCYQVMAASGSGKPYSLKIPGFFLDPGNGTPHRRRCLTALALLGKGAGHA